MGEYLHPVRRFADKEVEDGNFVTLERNDHVFFVEEHLLTFSGIKIKKWTLKDAYYAPSH